MNVDTGVLIGLINGAVLIVGYLISRRGTKEANKQQDAVNRLAERDADWKRRGDIINDLRSVIEAKDARIAHILGTCLKAQTASIDAIATLKAILRSEVAQEIADINIAEAKRHERDEH